MKKYLFPIRHDFFLRRNILWCNYTRRCADRSRFALRFGLRFKFPLVSSASTRSDCPATVPINLKGNASPARYASRRRARDRRASRCRRNSTSATATVGTRKRRRKSRPLAGRGATRTPFPRYYSLEDPPPRLNIKATLRAFPLNTPVATNYSN